jgi:succinate dehydrogenase / fumarate reductase iron-sulfur subunit
MVDYKIDGIRCMSFLGDVTFSIENVMSKGGEPVAFDHVAKKRCGMCSLFINGEAHGPDRLNYQLLRMFGMVA